jgi:hypothetical protein
MKLELYNQKKQKDNIISECSQRLLLCLLVLIKIIKNNNYNKMYKVEINYKDIILKYLSRKIKNLKNINNYQYLIKRKNNSCKQIKKKIYHVKILTFYKIKKLVMDIYKKQIFFIK